MTSMKKIEVGLSVPTLSSCCLFSQPFGRYSFLIPSKRGFINHHFLSVPLLSLMQAR